MPRASHRLPDANGSDVSICLTNAEIAELTDYRHRSKQIEALVSMEIPFRIAPTGGIKVLRSDVPPISTETIPFGIRSMIEPLSLDGPATILFGDCVYFLQFVGDGDVRPGLIKIGFSGCFLRRWGEVATEVRCKRRWLNPLLTVPGSRILESQMHDRFEDLREFGEWFAPEHRLLEYIQEQRSRL